MITFIIGLVLTGLVVGAIARLLVPGRDPMSVPMTILLGIVGSIIGGLVGRYVFDSDGGGFVLGIVAAVGLVLLLRRSGRGHRGTV
jgi:uncharacterized membrane protein YeaQ/YmgE (transglycosylase-associated protein family)